MRRPARAAPLLLAALALSLPAVLLRVEAWPDLVTLPYFVARGWALYDQVILQHTPLVPLVVAAAGRVFGFSGPLLRAVIAIPLAATGALLAGAVLRGGSRKAWLLLAGLPLAAAWTVYFEGPALWADAFVGPLVLAAAIVLEEDERRADPRAIRNAGLVLGTAILVKQTSAWILLFAALHVALLSRRRSASGAARLVAWASLPYAAFAVLWGAVFRTTAHVRWTLFVPFTGLAREIARVPDAADLKEILAPFLVLPGALLVALSLRRRPVSPLASLAAGAAGMAFPRWGLLHFSAATGLLALLFLRALQGAAVAAKRMRRHPPTRSAVLALGAGTSLLAIHFCVAVLGAGMLASGGHGVRFWDDPEMDGAVRTVEARVGRDETFLNYSSVKETVYPRTGTAAPGGIYVNARYWFYLNREGLDARLVEAARPPGTLVLFAEPAGPDAPEERRTALYRFLKEETEEVERLPGGLSWRRVRATPAPKR